jgi:hypothetical protein
MTAARQTAKTAPRPAPRLAATAEPRALVIADGTLEAIKWLALVLMTADHVNKFLFAERLPGVYEAGRIAFPLFAFVLGYNLARPRAIESGAYARTAKRLIAYGALAQVPFVAMVGWWPLNILFTLLLAVVVVWLLEAGGTQRAAVAAALLLVGGAFVEFWWFGVLNCIAAWAWCRRPSVNRTVACLAAIASLGVVNGNLWSLAVVPVIAVASHVDVPLRRWRHLFYAYYPGHLLVLWVLQEVTR